MPNPVCVLQILGNVLGGLAACLEDGAVFRQPARHRVRRASVVVRAFTQPGRPYGSRVNGGLKDDFGGRYVRVRGYAANSRAILTP
jgi:hypothetical protein